MMTFCLTDTEKWSLKTKILIKEIGKKEHYKAKALSFGKMDLNMKVTKY
jgi:hypothetical protein